MPVRAFASNPPALFCIGHSHLRCVQTAAADSGVAIRAINFWDDNSVILNSPDDPVLVDGLQQEIRAHQGAVYSFIGGGAHTVIGLVSHPRRYDFVLPENPDLPIDPRAELIPAEAVREVLTEEAAPYLKLMRHLRALLAPNGVRSARELHTMADGTQVAHAGLVICRQRPGTAKGFVFLTLEDETGTINVVVTPQRFERQALLISRTPLLLVRGVLQVESGVWNIRAKSFAPLKAGAGEDAVKGHNYR